VKDLFEREFEVRESLTQSIIAKMKLPRSEQGRFAEVSLSLVSTFLVRNRVLPLNYRNYWNLVEGQGFDTSDLLDGAIVDAAFLSIVALEQSAIKQGLTTLGFGDVNSTDI